VNETNTATGYFALVRDPTADEMLDWLDEHPFSFEMKLEWNMFKTIVTPSSGMTRVAIIAAMRLSGWRPGGKR